MCTYKEKHRDGMMETYKGGNMIMKAGDSCIRKTIEFVFVIIYISGCSI